MDEADRLDRHWASWINFTLFFFLYSGSAFIYLTFFLFLDRMCAGPSTLVKTFALFAELIGAKVTPMPLNHIDTKYDEMTLFRPQRKLRHNPTT